MITDACCSGQFDVNTGFIQKNPIVARFGVFVSFPEGRTVFGIDENRISDNGCYQDIVIIADPCTAQGCMRETVYNRIAVVVSRSAVPSAQSCIGTYLHHAERHGGAGIGVSVTVRSDKRIYVNSGVFRRTAMCIEYTDKDDEVEKFC